MSIRQPSKTDSSLDNGVSVKYSIRFGQNQSVRIKFLCLPVGFDPEHSDSDRYTTAPARPCSGIFQTRYTQTGPYTTAGGLALCVDLTSDTSSRSNESPINSNAEMQTAPISVSR